LANIIAWPAAYFLMENWLHNFAYRTTIDIWIFILSGFIEIEEKIAQIPGQTGVSRTIKSNFKTINGIPFAHKSETQVKGKKVATVSVKEIIINPQVDLAFF
jgi:hypothetical protein